MAEYCVTVQHQDFWRGQEHYWTTVYPYVGEATLGGGTTVTQLVGNKDAQLCYADPTSPGYITKVSLYDLTAKGTPLEVYDSGIAYNGDAWVPSGTPNADPVRETCAVLNWPAGMSRTGKPVFFRKYIHAVPLSAAVAGGVDINSDSSTAIGTVMGQFITLLAGHGLAMGNARRFAGSAVTVDGHYGNHQMPRGRKRPKP